MTDLKMHLPSTPVYYPWMGRTSEFFCGAPLARYSIHTNLSVQGCCMSFQFEFFRWASEPHPCRLYPDNSIFHMDLKDQLDESELVVRDQVKTDLQIIYDIEVNVEEPFRIRVRQEL